MYDLIYPPTEVGGIFITTKTISTLGQVNEQTAQTHPLQISDLKC